jgi:hypothetical protein
VRWRSVRGGTGMLAGTFSLLTLIAVGSRIWSMSAATPAGSDSFVEQAATFLLYGLAYQALYCVLAALLGVAAVRITRAPTKSGAVTPALIGAVCFGALALVVLMLLKASTTPEQERQLSETAVSGFWIAAVVLRTLAVGALTYALIRLARHLELRLDGAIAGGLFALLVVDAAAAVQGLLSPPSAETRGSPGRWALLLVQLAFAVLFVVVALRVRRALTPLCEEEALDERETGTARREQADAEDDGEAAEPAPVVPPPVEPEISPAARFGAAALAGLAAGALPLWDALDPRMRLELDGPSLSLSVGLAVCAVLVGLVLFQTLGSDAYRARAVLFGAAVIGIGYAAMTLYTIAVQRSELTDRLPVCESGEPPGAGLTRPLLSAIEGPRLENGAPCTRAGERRIYHLEEHPNGSFQDGLVQIGRRFVSDRPRAFGGSAAVLLALVLSGVIIFRAAPEPRSQEPSSQEPSSPESDDPPSDAAKRRKASRRQVRE